MKNNFGTIRICVSCVLSFILFVLIFWPTTSPSLHGLLHLQPSIHNNIESTWPLRLRTSPTTTTSPSIPPPAVREINQIYWLHIPKTGSSFVTVIGHYFCNVEDDFVCQPVQNSILKSMKYIQGNCSPDVLLKFKCCHKPLSLDDLEKYNGKIITMFRDPYKRILSGFFHNFHDCPKLQIGISEKDDVDSPKK